MVAKKPKWSTVYSRQWTDNWQSNDFDEVLTAGDVKIRIRMHHDYCYDKQCWGKVENWDGTGWTKVANAGQPRFPSRRVEGKVITDFASIRTELLRCASAIVF
jgi:hypothetical protein